MPNAEERPAWSRFWFEVSDRLRGDRPSPLSSAAGRVAGVVANPARTFDYHSRPLEPALAVVEAVRASTLALIRGLPDEAWAREGRHTESGRYRAEDWLRIYADHLEGHARQIENNVALWQAAQRR